MTNGFFIASGVVAAMTTAGHFIVGTPNFLRPMLGAQFDAVSQKVMHCGFHYVSVFLGGSAVAMLALGFGLIDGGGALLARFISANFALFAIVQLWLGATSGIERWPMKLFQWVFFVLIAALAWAGTL